ncbi:hypothetical protein PHISCL_04693 [Aspergillus sclerotialis]|uniref:DUF4440 domain-containing protein n=1 Tax=Aspergillus sclerotialis TaxID=2070753 RepID=A0A3A2ZIS8_9EURO|nr:hypothetical protein PHISCL_04693 [Aspergillus sclerotialis]
MDPSEINLCEQEAWNALCISGSKLIPMLAEDCIMLFPGGMALSTQSTPSLKSTLTSDMFVPWQKYVLSDSEVRLLDSRGLSALITYQVAAERPGSENEPTTFKALCSSTWRRTNPIEETPGQWEMVSHQQTPM